MQTLSIRSLAAQATAFAALLVLGASQSHAQSPFATGTYQTGGRVQGELHAAPSSGGQFEAFAYTGAPYGWYMRMWDSYTSTVFIAVPYYNNGTYLFFYFHGYTYDPGQPTNTSLWRAAHDGYIVVNPSSYSGYWATYYDHWSPTYGQSVSNPAWYQITFRF